MIIYWQVFDPKGKYIPSTISDTKDMAQARFLSIMRAQTKQMPRFKALGYSFIKIEIMEVPFPDETEN